MPTSSRQAKTGAPTVRVFISYSHKDERAREKLDVHLAQLKREGVEFWFDGDIAPGGEIDAAVRRAMRAADIFVALASPDYLHSSYCFDKEYSPALRKARRGGIRVVVAILRDCQWKHTRMAAYKALPTDGKAVDRWPRRGDAYEDIVNGLREAIKAVAADKSILPAKTRSASTARKPKPVAKAANAPTRKPASKSKAKIASVRKAGTAGSKRRTTKPAKKAAKTAARKPRTPSK